MELRLTLPSNMYKHIILLNTLLILYYWTGCLQQYNSIYILVTEKMFAIATLRTYTYDISENNSLQRYLLLLLIIFRFLRWRPIKVNWHFGTIQIFWRRYTRFGFLQPLNVKNVLVVIICRWRSHQKLKYLQVFSTSKTFWLIMNDNMWIMIPSGYKK